MRSHLRTVQPEYKSDAQPAGQRKNHDGPRLLVILSFLMIGLTTGTLVFSISLLGLPQPISEMTALPAAVSETIVQTTESEIVAESAEPIALVTETAGMNCATAIAENESWFYRQVRGLP
ncbi:MAG TPA: hypothetical protein DCM45_02890, partial [Clostridiales bacterium]|nr:hypothetical protein [Clostridiales bacterium]